MKRIQISTLYQFPIWTFLLREFNMHSGGMGIGYFGRWVFWKMLTFCMKSTRRSEEILPISELILNLINIFRCTKFGRNWKYFRERPKEHILEISNHIFPLKPLIYEGGKRNIGHMFSICLISIDNYPLSLQKHWRVCEVWR